MRRNTQTVRFYPDQGSPATLHIELPGGIVNIRVGLTDADGRQVNAIEILPSDESRGGDGTGRVWHLADDGYRLIRQAAAEDTDPTPATDEANSGGQWSLVTTIDPTDDDLEIIAGQILDVVTHGTIDRP